MTAHRSLGPSALDSEFDQHASDYDAGMGHPVKRLLGDSAAAFIDVKVRWLIRSLAKRRSDRQPDGDLKLLDFGCGDGLFLQRIQQLGIRCQAYGCDVSEGMLAQARKRFSSNAPAFAVIGDGRLSYEDNMFDTAIVSAVLHHVAPAERAAVYEELKRVLAPNGRCIVFEHNPFHPVVRYVVATTPIDRSAQLLSPRSVRRGMRAAGFNRITTRWLMFVPPRWRWAHSAEPWLEGLPLGGQYVVMAAKSRLDS